VAKLRITLVKSAIGYAQEQKDTASRLGLRKMWRTVEFEDNASIRGMVHKIRHLVKVEEVPDGEEGTK
jgi:large subunit ribosomal protein L30